MSKTYQRILGSPLPLFITLFTVVLLCLNLNAQDDSLQIRSIYDKALTEGEAYENLRQLCKDVGNRLSGSEGAQRAVEWSKSKMESYGFDKVWLEPLMVPKWTRGDTETCIILPEKCI